jgi:purine-binding chemotaxis protein CheW
MADDNTRDDIRSILHEMRDEYWKGLAEVEEALDEELECVIFTLGGETYAFETVHAAEVLRIPKLIKVPRVQEMIVGVFNLRGEITAAMDIRSLLGLPLLPISSAGRLIVVKSEKFVTGILTESVLGVAPLSFSNFEPATKNMTGMQRELIRGQIRDGDTLIILLDIVKLLASPDIIR